MIEWGIRVVLAVSAVVHLAALVGVVGEARLERLYGVVVADGDLTLLLRHRAVLLGVVGALFGLGAIDPSMTGAALVLGLTSTVSFVVLHHAATSPGSAAVRRVAQVDVVLSVALAVALSAHLLA